MAPTKRKLDEILPLPQPPRVAVCPKSVDELVRLTSSLTRTLKLASTPELKDGLIARSTHLNLIASFVHSALSDLDKQDRNVQPIKQPVTPTSATQRKARALYLCGRPGSGKSACVSAVIERLFGSANKRPVKSIDCSHSDQESSNMTNAARLVAATNLVPSSLLITLNAMSASNPFTCITTILSLAQSAVKARATNPQNVDQAIEHFKALCERERARHSRYVVLVIDELDALLPSFRARSAASAEARVVIEALFEMASLGELVIVALSNDINLIDSLAASHQPKKLVFSCYSQQEMSDILIERLQRGARDADFKLTDREVPLFDSKAVDFIVAASSKEGDLRTVIKLAAACVTHVPLSDAGLVNINALTVAKMKTTLGIGVSSVARASSLSSHQQCLLAAMATLQSQADRRRIDCSSLHGDYTRLSKLHKFLLPMSVSDLETALQALEAHGFVTRQTTRGSQQTSFATFIADPIACSHQCSDTKLTPLFETANEKRSAKKQKV